MTSLEICSAGIRAHGVGGLRLRRLYPTARFVVDRLCPKADFWLRSKWQWFRICWSLPRHLTPCHSEEPKRRGICCFSNSWSKADFSLPREM